MLSVRNAFQKTFNDEWLFIDNNRKSVIITTAAVFLAAYCFPMTIPTFAALTLLSFVAHVAYTAFTNTLDNHMFYMPLDSIRTLQNEARSTITQQQAERTRSLQATIDKQGARIQELEVSLNQPNPLQEQVETQAARINTHLASIQELEESVATKESALQTTREELRLEKDGNKTLTEYMGKIMPFMQQMQTNALTHKEEQNSATTATALNASMTDLFQNITNWTMSSAQSLVTAGGEHHHSA